MGSINFQAKVGNSNVEVTVGLTLYRWDEDGVYYVYSPALDLYGYGNTPVDATNSWEITFEEFIKYTHNKGTIFDELEKLGWTVNRKKKRVRAPEVEEMENNNLDFKNILKKSIVTEDKRLPILV
ncbi:MAG: hypothetical protein OEW75_03230 [Cyclobacteriaceae bacterium]|nr:hypothetical protein [Cyclobacteriaceae bacterium]